MLSLIHIYNITAEVTKAFVEAGYEEKFGKVTLSNRPDLCEFQCNGAMAAAKQYNIPGSYTHLKDIIKDRMM